MDDLNKEKNKSKEDKTHTKELHQENKQSSKIIDTSIFDTTLKDIEQILNALEQKIHSGENRLEKINYLPEINSTISKIHVAKNELIKEENKLINNNLISRIEILEKIINKDSATPLNTEPLKEIINETKEHKINKDHAIIEGFHEFDEFDEKNNKKKVGFYGYLILTVVVLFALFIALSISKDLIISKYPITESYIQYFFEIIEIVKITIRDL